MKTLPTSDKYWKKRFELKEQARNTQTKEYLKELQKEYRAALESINKDVALFYSKYAAENNITLAKARKLLSSIESQEKLDKLRKLLKSTINPESGLTVEANRLLSRSRLTRLEGLQADLLDELARIENTLQEGVTTHLTKLFKDEYYETIYEIHKGTGIAAAFNKVPVTLIETTLAYPWSGETYSKRIWNNNYKLVNTLKQELTQGFIKGDSIPKIAKRLQVKMESGYKEAIRLVNTEASFICNVASLESYKECSVEQYEFLTTLDDRTSVVCGDMDGLVVDVDKAETGRNLPPMHINCRSTTVPYFDDAYDERVARSGKKIYNIPGNMSFAEWQKKYCPESSIWITNDKGQTLHRDTGEIID